MNPKKPPPQIKKRTRLWACWSPDRGLIYHDLFNTKSEAQSVSDSLNIAGCPSWRPLAMSAPAQPAPTRERRKN